MPRNHTSQTTFRHLSKPISAGPFGTDVETAKRHYLAQWAHVDCGGAPVAFVNGGMCCARCRVYDFQISMPGSMPLGQLVQTKVFKKYFRRLVV